MGVLLLGLAAPAAGAAPGGRTAAAPRPFGYTLYADRTYGPYGVDNLLDIYVPEGVGPFPAVVIVHSGGWKYGDKTEWAPEAIKLADAGIVAVSVNYREALTARYPAQLTDLQSAVRWIRVHATRFSIDPTRIGAFGSSTGGHLAAMLAMAGSGPLSDGSRVRVVVTWSGIFDLTTFPGHGPNVLFGCDVDACPQEWQDASPLYSVDRTDPPAFMANSWHELIPADQPARMSDAMTADGIWNIVDLIKGSRHGRTYEPLVWDQTVAFFRAWLDPAASLPAAIITSGPSNPTTEKTATFEFHSNAPFATFACVRDEEEPRKCDPVTTFSDLSPGPHTFSVQATDLAGHHGQAAIWAWTITPPAGSIGAGARGQTPSRWYFEARRLK